MYFTRTGTNIHISFFNFNAFFFDDAAALFPNINVEVRLSAPVVLEIELELAKRIYQFCVRYPGTAGQNGAISPSISPRCL